MRLMARSSVLLPEPLAPMSASTDRSGTSRETPFRACVSPYHTERSRTSSVVRAGAPLAGPLLAAGAVVGLRSVMEAGAEGEGMS